MTTRRSHIRVTATVGEVERAIMLDFMRTLNPNPRRVGTTALIDTTAILRATGLPFRIPAHVRHRYEDEVRRRGRWWELEKYERECDEVADRLQAEFGEVGPTTPFPVERIIELVDEIPTPGMDA